MSLPPAASPLNGSAVPPAGVKFRPAPATRTSENSSEPNLGNNLASNFGCDL